MTLLDASPEAPPVPAGETPEAPGRRWWQRQPRPDPGSPLPPLSPRLRLARLALILVAIVAGSLVVQLVVVSGLQQRATQQRLYDSFRLQLAEGTAPVNPVDSDGQVVAVGAPVAYIEIPGIGVSEVVVSGTTSGATFNGPGHRRDTGLPGTAGTSVVLGRSETFGGPFGDLAQLGEGDVITVTTGLGVTQFEVIGVRREGDPVPPLSEPDEARLLLMTTEGGVLAPSSVLRVDAVATTPAISGAAPLFAPTGLPPAEQVMASDTTTLWALVLWLEALVIVVLGLVWAWHRWSRVKAWVVFVPLVVVVGLATSREVARLLPNML